MQIKEKRKSCIHQLAPVDQSLDKGDGGAGHHGEEDAQEDPEQGDALRRMENECFRCTKTIPKTVLISSAAMHGDSMGVPLNIEYQVYEFTVPLIPGYWVAMISEQNPDWFI